MYFVSSSHHSLVGAQCFYLASVVSGFSKKAVLLHLGGLVTSPFLRSASANRGQV